ncbi:hypothetical protein SNE40_022168 [Patella caerulea]|uniref:galactosylceramidase n=1 Tax=Patella caerulea TaxID=87958 RepID=A0AAN8G3G2_PATCE
MEIFLFGIFLSSLFAVCHSVYFIDETPGFGRRFDGIGGLSGGSATSKLLIAYPQKQRDEILDILFKPNFAASLQILKVEIGGDSQASDATEASHMHNSSEESYDRGYEWWLMKEAKKRNPNIKLYGLPWAFPGWLGNGTQNPYQNIDQLAEYVRKWVQGAKEFNGLTIDYIGIWNEKLYNIPYMKRLRQVLDENLLTETMIVAADLNGDQNLASHIIADPELNNVIFGIGLHYPATNTTVEQLRTGKPIWASEDYSTFNNNTGGACWARILNQNYVNGFITGTIAWNLIDSYYTGLPWDRDSLMTAREPWSGYYQVESPIWVTAHTTQFVYLGWVYLRHGSGVGFLENGGSYVTMTTDESINNDFALIIETMTQEHSACIRPPLPYYPVAKQNVTFILKGKFRDTFGSLNVWYTKLGFNGEQSTFFKQLKPVKVTNDEFSLSLGLNEIWTITNAGDGNHGITPTPPPSKPFPLPYRENFEEYVDDSEAYYFAQQCGVYEIVTVEKPYNKVMRQTVLQEPIVWCESAALTNKTLNVIGATNWTDIYIETDARVNHDNGTSGVFLAGRVNNAGCTSYAAWGIFFFIQPAHQTFSVSSDLQMTNVLVTSRKSTSISNEWNKISLLISKTYSIGMVNGEQLFNITILSTVPAQGFVALGTQDFGSADFDNVNITNIQDGVDRLKQLQDQRLYFHGSN